MRLALLLALAASSASCVSFTWERDTRYEPVPAQALGQLRAGESDLGHCLAALGAPLWVWEHPEGGRGGAVLAYGWFEQRAFKMRVQVPLGQRASGSLDYDRSDARLHGLVLFFDADWKLLRWQSGLLRDLAREARRPSAVEGAES